ncbi:MAG: DUF6077 domain-containing protein [Halioglobus sp.]
MKRSIGDLLLIGGASLFASWTLYCYVMVLFGLGFHDLMTWSLLPLIGGVLLTILCTDSATNPDSPSSGRVSAIRSPAKGKPWYIGTLGILATAVVILFHLDAAYWLVWVLLLCSSLVVLRITFTTGVYGQTPLPQQTSKLEGFAVAALMIICAVLTAVVHRSDLDDSQYLNFIVTALDFPVEPLFSHSGLWADHSVPLELPLYRFHSYELWIAALSQITGVDHKIFYYLVLPPLFAAAAALVHWRIARHLLHRHALLFVLIWLVLLLALGESHRAFGNFAFVRLYQGKSLLATAALPLCLLMGLKFSETPGWRRALALGLAVIASLGLSSSALATVPVVTAAVLGGGLLGASRGAVRNVVAGGLASILLLIAIAAYVMTTMNIGDGLYGDALPSAGNGLSMVLGGGVLGAIILAAFPLAPVFVGTPRRRQIYATTSFLFVLGVLNPWASPFFARMFDLAIQWRLFWSVPFIISAAICLVGLVDFLQSRLTRAITLVVIPVLALALLLLSDRLSIAPDNNVTLALPHYKVEREDYQLAAEIVRIAAPRSTVYAPTRIAAWIASFRHHPYPLIFRQDYLYFGRVQKHVGFKELERRKRVIRFLEGEDTHPYTSDFFLDQLARDRPSVVVYPDNILMARVIGHSLDRAGYSGKLYGQYWLWQRTE